MMRASSDTERTQVSTRAHSINHLDTLSEKQTNMSNPTAHLRQQTEDRFDNNDVVEAESANNGSDESVADKDLETGDEAGDDKKAEELKRKETKEKDPNLIEWDGPDDPENPMNWPTAKKWIVTVTLGLMTFCVTFASSVFSNATVPTAELFGVSTEVTTLGTSLFVLGFGAGPLVSRSP